MALLFISIKIEIEIILKVNYRKKMMCILSKKKFIFIVIHLRRKTSFSCLSRHFFSLSLYLLEFMIRLSLSKDNELTFLCASTKFVFVFASFGMCIAHVSHKWILPPILRSYRFQFNRYR